MLTLYPVIIPNWTTQCIICFISTGNMAATFFLSLYHYNKQKYRPFFFLTVTCLFATLMSIFYGLSDLFLSIPLFLLSIYLFIPMGFCIIFLIDSISRESIDPIKLMTLGMISMAILFFSIDPNSVVIGTFPNGEWRVFFNDFMLFVMSLLFLMDGSLYVYYVAKIYRDAPKNLKIQALLLLLSGINLGFIAPGSIIRLLNIIPGIHIALFSVGILISGIIFCFYPKLAYVLPFKVLRLAIIETNSGIPLFTHNWESGTTEIDPLLFSGMMHAIGQFIRESLNKGNVREIHLDEAILILKRSNQFPVVCVLVSTNSSKILRETLNYFAEQFFNKFSQYFSNPNNLDNFITTSDLILEYFPFVPEYD